MNQPLSGRTALVTGFGRNLGKGAALALAGTGANIVPNGDRDQTALNAAAEKIRALGVDAMTVLINVSEPAAVLRVVDQAVEQFGGVDIAISNASVNKRSKCRYGCTAYEYHIAPARRTAATQRSAFAAHARPSTHFCR